MRVNKQILFFGDILFLNVALVGAFGTNASGSELAYAHQIIFSNVAWVFLVLVTLPYHFTRSLQLSRLVRNQASFLFVHLLVIASLTVLFDLPVDFGRLGLFYVIFVFLFFVYRVLLLYIVKIFSRAPRVNYVLVGRNSQSFEIRRSYLLQPDLGFRFIGFVDAPEHGLPLHQLHSICDSHEVNEIIWCHPPADAEELAQLVQFSLNSLIKVRIVAGSKDEASRFLGFQRGDQPSRQLAVFTIDDGVQQFLKRSFDLLFSFGVFACVFSWLFPVIAIAIKLDSKGPVFFIQQRNGLGNRPFGCYKFRTMIVNEESDSKQATKNDPRITRLGAFLRKSSIDELPQFINVLKGDMSLIGPRPHPIKLNEKFEPFIANIMSRHYVKPGITGLAQCMGYRGETQTVQDMENRVRLDRYYIENWSFWLDIKIIFLTVVSLIRGSDKAY